MKIPSLLWTASTSLSLALAQSTTTTTPTPSCTATPLAKLCSYPDPLPEFGVAAESRAGCQYSCTKRQPCNFSIFVLGNPYTGTGACMLYPGQSYNASAGSETGCSNPHLFVDDKPVCAPTATTTTTSGAAACSATASPTPIATVCGLEPPETCWSTCKASSGASHCLGMCVDAEKCAYAVFVPRNKSGSEYADGTCWIYESGAFDKAKATTCKGKAEQFVYTNVCPKPSSSSSRAASSGTASSSSSTEATATAAAGGSGVGAAGVDAEKGEANGQFGENRSGAAAGVAPFSCAAVGVAMLVWRVLLV